MSSIQETTLGKINKGNAILSHNGNDYGFTENSSEDITYTKIMVPKVSDDSYHAGNFTKVISSRGTTNGFIGAKPIDRILHLQQIVQLPSVYDANAKQASSSTARPTIPAKKPVRQQPPGLKMRFRPIGFGSGSTGTIGSSSSSTDGSGAESDSDEEMDDPPRPFRRPASFQAEESATSSDGSSDDSSSSSDAEMTEAPPLPSKPAGKTQSEKSAAKESSKVADHPLKRKHSEGGDIKAKNSSSSSEAYTSNRELKRLKKKQTNSLAGSQSVSTETRKTTYSKLPHVAPNSTTPIPPPKANRNHLLNPSSQILLSPAKSAPILPPKSSRVAPPRTSQNSNAHPASKKLSEIPSRDKEKTHDASPGVSERERKKEVKRHEKEKSKLQPKADVKEPIITPSSRPDTTKLASVPASSLSSGHLCGLSKSSSSQSQSLPRSMLEEKRDSKDEKEKKRKKVEKAGKENGRAEQKDSISTPILPPKRSSTQAKGVKTSLSAARMS